MSARRARRARRVAVAAGGVAVVGWATAVLADATTGRWWFGVALEAAALAVLAVERVVERDERRGSDAP